MKKVIIIIILTLLLYCRCTHFDKKETLFSSIQGVEDEKEEKKITPVQNSPDILENISTKIQPTIRELPRKRKPKKYRSFQVTSEAQVIPSTQELPSKITTPPQESSTKITPPPQVISTKITAEPQDGAQTQDSPNKITPPPQDGSTKITPPPQDSSTKITAESQDGSTKITTPPQIKSQTQIQPLPQSTKEYNDGNLLPTKKIIEEEEILDLDILNKKLFIQKLISNPKKKTLTLNITPPTLVHCRNCYNSFQDLSYEFSFYAKSFKMEGIGLFCPKNNLVCSIYLFEKVKFIRIDSEISFISALQILNSKAIEGDIFIFTPSSACMLCLVLYNKLIQENQNLHIYHFYNEIYNKDLSCVFKGKCFKNSTFYKKQNKYQEFREIIIKNLLNGVTFINLKEAIKAKGTVSN